MAAHLKPVGPDYAKPPRLEPTPAAEGQQTEQTERNRKLTFNDMVVAFIAGVIAAWIND